MTTTVAERVRRHRLRKKIGAAVLPFVIVGDEVATVEMLIDSGVLDPNRADDVAAVAAAVGKMIDAYATKHKLESMT